MGLRWAVGLAVVAACAPSGVLAQPLQLPDIPPPLELRFDVERFEVEGNTLLPRAEVDAIAALFVGEQRNFGDVQRLIEALEAAYRARGYTSVQVYLPEQQAQQGVVRISVIEARIRAVVVRQNKFFDEANVRASLPSLREGEAPNADELAQNLRVVNENPAKQTTVLLRAGEKQGDIDAVIDVADDDPRRWFLTVDNTGSAATGHKRFGIGFQNANMFNRDHALTLQYVTSDRSDLVKIYSAGYHVPLYRLAASMDFVIGYSDVAVGTTSTPLGSLDFSGRGTVMGARYSQQLWRIPGYDHKLSAGIDHRVYKNSCSVGDFGSAGCGPAAASFTVTPLSLGYSGTFGMERGQAGIFGTLVRNIPGVGTNSDAAALNAARAGTDAKYKLLRFGASLAHGFDSDWQLRVAVLAQHASVPLVPPEQFSVAGQSAVRGYLEREVASDRGRFANVELYTPNFGKEWSFRMLGFYDAGRVRRVNPAPGDIDKEGISSVGIGLRASLRKEFIVRADLAHVLEPGGGRRSGEKRLGFSALWAF